jgi:hypothetical protein
LSVLLAPPEPLPPVADAVALGEEDAPLDDELLAEGLGVLEGDGVVEALADRLGLVERLELPLLLGERLPPEAVPLVEVLRDRSEAAGLSVDPDPRLTA